MQKNKKDTIKSIKKDNQKDNKKDTMNKLNIKQIKETC